MNQIFSMLAIFAVFGGMGIFLGNFNKILDDFGILYYWNAVGAGLFIYSVLFFQHYRRKVELKRSAKPVTIALYLSIGVFGLPISASILINELSFISPTAMQIGIPVMIFLFFVTSAISIIKFKKKE